MKPLDDHDPASRAAIATLRALELDPDGLDRVIEAVTALLAPKVMTKVNATMKAALAARDKKWRVVVAELRAKIERLRSE